MKPTNYSTSLWRSRLSSSSRTALACAVVGITTLYSPSAVKQQFKFPSFSYMTAVVIVGDATVGDSLKCAMCALYGSALGLVPSMVALHLLHVKYVSYATVGVVVALASFMVVVFDTTALVTKRIALCQIVIMCVSAFKEARHGEFVVDFVPVFASTLLGALASVFALMFPYPRLASYKVNKKNNLYIEMAMERFRLIVNGICSDSTTYATFWASQVKLLSNTCDKLLKNIMLIQGSTQWERALFKFIAPQKSVEIEVLQAIDIPLKGMEIALASITSFPIETTTRKLKDTLSSQIDQISLKFHESTSSTLEPVNTVVPQNFQNLPFLFFLFCMKLIRNVATNAVPYKLQNSKIKILHYSKEELTPKRASIKIITFWPIKISKIRLVTALKISLSLSLAVIFGILISNENGYWSGLTVAIAFTPYGNSTFSSASARAHGTALGSVYGVIGSTISKNLMQVRVIFLLPWILFTSFLYRSRMYGETGAFAATISSIVILGRKNYGSPMVFAVERLTQTYIGLFCAVLFELLLQPKRASTLARIRVYKSLVTLHECLDLLEDVVRLKEKEMKLRGRVKELKKFIGEAELEPNFWFLPFPTTCYKKIQESLSRTVDLLLFMRHSYRDEIDQNIKEDLHHFKKLATRSIECFENVLKVKSLARFETSSNDIEKGKGLSNVFDGEEGDEITDSFLQKAETMLENMDKGASKESKDEMILCLASFAFCIRGLMKEMESLEEGILELVQCENPSCYINLHDISCKLKEVSE